MENRKLRVYLNALTGHIYKMLPLYEEERERDSSLPDLTRYIYSLSTEVTGGFDTFAELSDSPSYIFIVNTIHGLNQQPLEYNAFRRQVFKMLSLIQRIDKEVGERHV